MSRSMQSRSATPSPDFASSTARATSASAPGEQRLRNHRRAVPRAPWAVGSVEELDRGVLLFLRLFLQHLR